MSSLFLDNSIRQFYCASKRKSAVELLQETKAFYVKSETVLDRQQQLKHAGHLQVTSSAMDTVFLRGPRPRSDPAPDHKYIHPHVLLLSPAVAPAVAPRAVSLAPACAPAPAPAPAVPPPLASAAAAAPPPPLPPKSPRLVSAAQRRAGSHPSGGSDQLQTKLRRLLNADSKENLFLGGGPWADEDSKTVACDERPFTRNSCPRSPAGCSIHKSLPDLHAGAATSPTTSTEASEVRSISRLGRRSCGSAMSTHSSGGIAQKALKESTPKNAPCVTPFMNSQHRAHPIMKSETVITHRSGMHSLDTFRNDVSCEEILRSSNFSKKSVRKKISHDTCDGPTSNSSFSDSGAEDISSPQPLRATPINQSADRHRPILRSKSDISHRYSRGNMISTPRLQPQEPHSNEQLEQFFEQLGLEANDYRSLATPLSGSSSPIFFESVSSVDSAVIWGPDSGGTSGNHQRPSEQLSIVERNARIIKWLCNCRKAQLSTHSPS
ncbi:hypothetical protein R5R35_009442 [Gryllus longicercus]|uniref:Centrosome-associated FAM110 C-terminal domain-containing protein n=1 Tax=Gryllus longicercus TaxID=2509291 RepID=A0AAN9VD35_9ORTH